MSKGRTQSSSNWESQPSLSPYLDSAYKQLLRQEHKSTALKNRSKVLQLNHDSIVKQIQNNHNKWNRLESIKQNHFADTGKIVVGKKAKDQQSLKLKVENQRKRENHFRQMSQVALQKAEDIHRIKRQALMLRQQNQRLIEQHRQAEIEKKKEVRNKIHEDIVESRTTIKNFFTQKHQNIVAANTDEVRKLNAKRVKEELESMSKAGREVAEMEEEIKQLRQNLYESRVNPAEKWELTKKPAKTEPEEKHVLVRRIENAMNKYIKAV